MKFKVNGVEMDATGMRVREVCEAEKFLGMDMSEGFGAKIAVALFVAMRRHEPNKPAGLIAKEALSVDIEQLGEDEEVEAVPPADEPADEAGNGQVPESLLTTGPPPSVPSA